MKLLSTVIVFVLVLSSLQLFSCGGSKMSREIVFQESKDDFPNPERGFYRARELTFPENFDLRGENITLIYGRISADDFRDKPFSEEFLTAIQWGFDEARKNGIKVNPRVAYNSGPHPGAKARYGDSPNALRATARRAPD